MKLFRPLDSLLVAALVIATLIAVYAFQGSSGNRAEVHVDGEPVAVFDLESQPRQAEIDTRIGRIQLEIGRGTIRVLNSPCPQKICMLQGEIAHTHQQIICLPARMTIRIINSADHSTPQFDAISH